VIQSNDELISYRLKKLTISVGNRNFFYPLRVGLFNTSLMEFPLLVWWRENTRMMTLITGGEKSLTIRITVST